MKVGDLVSRRGPSTRHKFGLVVETGIYVGGNDIKIFWLMPEEVRVHASKWLEVISESR